MEQADVVIVGARCAGTAAAAPLARAGRRVVVLDRMRFPSDQLSTHVLQPAGASELVKLGAMPRILALNPSLVRWVRAGGRGRGVLRAPAPRATTGRTSASASRATCRTCSSSRPRASRAPTSARAAPSTTSSGARAGSPACATATRTASRASIGATLVIGADGRRSTVASLVGSWTPYRMSRNGRGLVFRYLDDPRAGTRDAETYYQWREGDSFAFAFPTAPGRPHPDPLHGPPRRGARGAPRPGGLLGAQARASTRGSPSGSPGATARTRSCARPARRPRSSAPRPDRAGRSPATPGTSRTRSPARGCATRCGRAARSPRASCRCSTTRPRSTCATRTWEARRDRECMPSYHFANADTRVERQSPTAVRARPRGRAARPSPTSATCSAAPARRRRSRRSRGSPARPARRCAAASARGARRSSARPPTCAPSSRSGWRPAPAASAARGPSRAPTIPGAEWPAPPTAAPHVPARRALAPGLVMTRIAVVQPALELGAVERNLARIEDLSATPTASTRADVVVVPGGVHEPERLRADPARRRAPGRRPAVPAADAAGPRAGLRRRAAGSSRSAATDAYGTYVLAEPDGAVHLHDKDIPTAWEQNYYVGGDDDGVVRCETLGATVGLMSGWEWARNGTAARVRAGGAQLVHRRHVLALDAAELARAAALVGRPRARDLAPPGARAARAGGADHRRPGRPRLARRAGRRADAARPGHPVARP